MTCAQVQRFPLSTYSPCKVGLGTVLFQPYSYLVVRSNFTSSNIITKSLIAFFRLFPSVTKLVSCCYHHFYLLPPVSKEIKRCEDHAPYTLLGCVLRPWLN